MSQRRENQRFEENFRKIELLSNDLQENRVGLDELVPRMKDALAAMKVCREVLQETKTQLQEMGNEFKALQQLAEAKDNAGEDPAES